MSVTQEDLGMAVGCMGWIYMKERQGWLDMLEEGDCDEAEVDLIRCRNVVREAFADGVQAGEEAHRAAWEMLGALIFTNVEGVSIEDAGKTAAVVLDEMIEEGWNEIDRRAALN